MGNTVNCTNPTLIGYEERLAKAELEVLKLTDIPLEKIDRKRIWF